MSIISHIAASTDIAAITDQGEALSYGQLRENAAEMGKHLDKRGLAMVLCDNCIGSLVGYVGLLEADIPTVLLDAQKPGEVIGKLISIYQPMYVWAPKAAEIAGETVYRYADYELKKLQTEAYAIHPEVALLLTTSGSTGSPKLVKITHRNIEANAQSIAQYLGIDANERPITSLPMHYSYGLSVINSHLLKGATILLTSKSVLQREFWDFAREHGATSIAGVPYTYEMLRRLRIFRMDLPALRTLTQAGGKLNAKIVKEMAEGAEASGRRFIVMYGQTEATARMSYLPQEYTVSKSASIGIAIPQGRLYLIDADGQEISDSDEEGELIYEGPNVSMGYAESMADLATGDENNGVLHTGDLAVRDTDGYYYITGRLKRFVKVWGNRCNLDSIEQIVKGITDECACVGVDDLITIFVTREGLEHQIITMLSERTGLNSRAFKVMTIDAIPKNASGKTLYPTLQNMIKA